MENFELQVEYETAMLLENTAIAEHKADIISEYKMEQREIDAEYEKEMDESRND